MNEYDKKENLKEEGRLHIRSLVVTQKPGDKVVRNRRWYTGNLQIDENDVRAEEIIAAHNTFGLPLEEIQEIITNTKGKHKKDMLEALNRARKIIALREQDERNERP